MNEQRCDGERRRADTRTSRPGQGKERKSQSGGESTAGGRRVGTGKEEKADVQARAPAGVPGGETAGRRAIQGPGRSSRGLREIEVQGIRTSPRRRTDRWLRVPGHQGPVTPTGMDVGEVRRLQSVRFGGGRGRPPWNSWGELLPGPGPGTRLGPGTGTRSGPGPGIRIETGTETGIETGIGPGIGIETGTGPETRIERGTRTDRAKEGDRDGDRDGARARAAPRDQGQQRAPQAWAHPTEDE